MQAAQKLDAAALIPQSTARPELDAILETLRDARRPTGRVRPSPSASRWRRQMLDGYVAVAEASVLAGCHAKGHRSQLGAGVARSGWPGRRRRAQPAPADRDAGAACRPGGRRSIRRACARGPMGASWSRCSPASGIDKVLFAGFTAEVWMQPGIKAPEVTSIAPPRTTRRRPRSARARCRSCSAPATSRRSRPTDAIYKMFVEGKVCLIKMNPVNAHVGPFIEQAFKAAIDAWLARGVLRRRRRRQATSSSIRVVDEIHITGSDKTHDLMVWGPPGAEREARKAEERAALEEGDHQRARQRLAGDRGAGAVQRRGAARSRARASPAAIANNASFNCNSAKLLGHAEGLGQDATS